MAVRLFFIAVLLFSLSITVPNLSSEEVYRWTDEKGTIHFTDDVSKIPEKFRREAEGTKVTGEVVKEEEAKENQEIRELGKSGEGADRVRKYLEKTDRKIEAKRRIEKKISELEGERKLAEERLKSIEDYERENYYYYMPYKDPKTGNLVPMASPYYGEKVRLENRIGSIEREIEALQEKVSNILKSLQ